MSRFGPISLWKALFLLLLSLKNTFASEILEIDSETLGELINSQEIVLLQFYAPWCEHCKHFEPHFDKLLDKAQSLEQNIIFAKINAEKNKNVVSFFDIQGYPTLLLFVNGDPIFYSGEMTSEVVFNWTKDTLNREPAEIRQED